MARRRKKRSQTENLRPALAVVREIAREEKRTVRRLAERRLAVLEIAREEKRAARRLAKKQAAKKQAAKKPAAKKPVAKKPLAKKPVAKKPVAKKPVTKKPVAKKPVAKKPVAKKPVAKKPVAKKPVTKKPVAKKPPTKKPPAKKPPAKKPPAKKRPAKKPEKPQKRPSKKPKKRKVPRRYPFFMRAAAAAEMLMMEKLAGLEVSILSKLPDLNMTVKSFINADGTVDGELRLRDLPDEWRTVEGMPQLVEAFSNAFRAVGAFPAVSPMGGAFWISCGLRFGPKDRSELEQIAKFYKRFRGLLQVGAYYSSAQHLTPMLNNLLAIRMLVERVWDRRNLPPIQLLVRFAWTPTSEKPARWKGEEGIKE